MVLPPARRPGACFDALKQDWFQIRPRPFVCARVSKAENHANAAALSAIDAELKTEMDNAMKFAIAAPYPGVEQVDQDVYA